MPPIVLQVENLSKKFTIGQKRSDNFREDIVNTMRKWWSAGSIKQKNTNEFWALDKVSFSLEKGEILGIIGENGAGKSTLLKILSQITAPSNGTIKYKGKFTAILDIGTGFHPELTGRENVYLSGSILGLSQQQIKDRFDTIVAFSGITDFIDTPVKHYSNGMYLRLAFSVAFHLDVDILLLDEVLSVGDAAFRRKAYDKIVDLANSGATILLVSHNVNEITDLCTKCMLLEKGRLKAWGTPKQIMQTYIAQHLVNKQQRIGNDKFTLQKVSIHAQNKLPDEAIYLNEAVIINFYIEKKQSPKTVQIILYLFDLANVRLLTDSEVFREGFELYPMPKGNYQISCKIPPYLLNHGLYSIGMLVVENKELVGEWTHFAKFNVLPTAWERDEPWTNISACIRPQLNWEVQRF